jgi:peptide/nickel transport system permease protein
LLGALRTWPILASEFRLTMTSVTSVTARRTPRTARNWPLDAGALLVTLILIVAIAGPWLAPQDPMARTSALNVEGQWVGPPFPAFSSGFLLGSDAAGRDLFSRLLWGIRPTLAMVAIIAGVRLLLGLIIGVAAGYGSGWGHRVASAGIRLALTLPVLVVALATIAFVGIQSGLFAFLLGLSLTGWAETARYVETQTRVIKQQPYMEAAAAMGAPRIHLVLYHVLRHLLPLTTMLLALEVSGTLMTTAALGFLGYYIGGGAWLTVEDFVAANTAGMPELGQMLATSLEQLLNPWPMVVVGGAVVVIIFGFSLLGEGLRRQLEDENAGQLAWLHAGLNWASGVIGGGLLPASPARRRRLGLAGTAALVALASVLGAGWWFGQARSSGSIAFDPTPPGGHLWATQRHDPYGAMTIAGSGPLTPSLLWSFEMAAGFTGGPAVDAAGNVYIAAKDGTVLALDSGGQETQRWTVPAQPVGAPALGEDGTVYVVDSGPGLSALAPDGSIRWRFSNEGRRATSGPIVGPDSTIYFTRVDRVQAVNSDGSERWISGGIEGSTVETPPRLSPDGSMVFLGNSIFLADSGLAAAVEVPLSDDLRFMMPTYATGADGNTYMLAGANAIRWHIENSQAVADEMIAWDIGGLSIYLPTDSGVAADGKFWVFFGTNFGNSRLAWLDADSRALANMEVSYVRMRLAGLDAANRGYLCTGIGPAACLALDLEVKGAIWKLELPGGTNGIGSALVPGRLYAATEDGWLHAIGDDTL